MFLVWRKMVDPVELVLSRQGGVGTEKVTRNIIPLSTQWWWNQYRANTRPQRNLTLEEIAHEWTYIRQRCRQLGWSLPRTQHRRWFSRNEPDFAGTALVPCVGDRGEAVAHLARSGGSGGGGFATVIAVDFLDRALRRLGPSMEACASSFAPPRKGPGASMQSAIDDGVAAIASRVKGLCADLFVLPIRQDLVPHSSVDFIFDRAAMNVQDPTRRGEYLDAISTLTKPGGVAYFNGIFRNEVFQTNTDTHWGSQTESVVARGRGNVPIALLQGPPFHTHPRDLEASLKLRGWEVDVDIGPLLQQIRNFSPTNQVYAEYRVVARYAPSEIQRRKTVDAAMAAAAAAEGNVVESLSLAATLDRDSFDKEAREREDWVRKLARGIDYVKREAASMTKYVRSGFQVDDEELRVKVAAQNQASGIGSGAFVSITREERDAIGMNANAQLAGAGIASSPPSTAD